MAADRTDWRSLVCFLLGRFRQKLALQTPRLLQNLLLQMAESFIRGLDALVQARRQTRLPVGHRLGERLVASWLEQFVNSYTQCFGNDSSSVYP
jgi:hypothetical protein